MRHVSADSLLTSADLAATLLFSLEGAATAVLARTDLLGVVVIAFVTALGGGMIRDVLLGDAPVAALRSIRYPGCAFGGAVVVAAGYQVVAHVPSGIFATLDALGLGLFCVTGTAKAADHHMNAVAAVLLGAITACGGGALRDVLLNQVPVVLRIHIYAVAALAGAITMVVLLRAGAPRWLSMTAGVVVCVALRLLAVVLDWNLPIITT